MVRIEVITKPGMGNWRGMMQLRLPRRVDERDQHVRDRAWPGAAEAVHVQLPGAGGQGQDQPVDSPPTATCRTTRRRSSRRRRPARSTIRCGGPVDGVNASVRLEQAARAPSNILRAEYSRRENTRGNLGVGDFDLHERAYAADTIDRHAARAQHARRSARRCSASSASSSRSRRRTPRVVDDDADRPRARSVHVGRRRAGRHARRPPVHRRAELRLHHREAHAARRPRGRRRLVGQQPAVERQRHVHVLEPGRLTRPAGRSNYTRRVGDPQVSYSQYEAGWYIQDDFRVSKNLNVSLGLRQEVQTHVDDKLNLGAARGVHLGAAQGQHPRRLRHLLRLARVEHLRADRAGRRHAPDRRGDHQSVVPGSSSRGRAPSLPPSLHPARAAADAADDSSGVDRLRAAVRRVAATSAPTTCGRAAYDTLRSVNVNAPIHGVRPDPTAGNITQIESTGKRASDRITVGHDAARAEARADLMGNVMYQYANTRNFADSPLSLPSEQQLSPTPTGARRRWTSAIACS